MRSNSQVQGSSESLYMSPDPRLWSHSVSGATKAWRVCSSKPMGCLSERPRVPVLRTGQTAPVSTLSSKPSNVHRERDPRKWIRGGEKSDLVPSTGCTPQNSPEGPQAELDHIDYPNCIGQQPYHLLSKTTLTSMALISGQWPGHRELRPYKWELLPSPSDLCISWCLETPAWPLSW